MQIDYIATIFENNVIEMKHICWKKSIFVGFIDKKVIFRNFVEQKKHLELTFEKL